MPNSEQQFLDVRKYLTIWITEVALSNAISFFDINKISEGTSQVLLNMIYGYNLYDLNNKKYNFPGIDLGDSENGIAFQITSENSNQKILSTLKIFHENSYKIEFPKGVKFLIINKKKNNRFNKNFLEYQDIFDAKKDILYPNDLVKEMQNLYYKNRHLFDKIIGFLKTEFGKNNKEKSELFGLHSTTQKFGFYNKVFSASYKSKIENLVHFDCNYQESTISTADLMGIINESNGLIITGPSGCGKSAISQKLAVDFLKFGMSIILQCKYYQTNLTKLIDKEVIELGFTSASLFFATAKELKLHTLVVVDGFNECDKEKQSKLLVEIQLLIQSFDAKIILSSQKDDGNFANLECERITVSFPTIEIKKEIASSYSGNNKVLDLLPLITTVNSSMEAKMIGEIATLERFYISRFTLFEIFLKYKLDEEKGNGFLLLARFANILSEKISFSAPERTIEKILRENSIPERSYYECLKQNILNLNLGQVSFGHEMFFNFFVAESIVRFSKNTSEISHQINAPKNHDKRLLILGSINDSKLLNDILADISDVNLLNSILSGDAGEYCQRWCQRKMREILKKIDQEIGLLEFEFTNQKHPVVEINSSALTQWDITEKTFILVIPYRLAKGDLLKDVFDLIGRVDHRIDQKNKEYYSELKKKGLHNGVFFWVVYIGITKHRSAITSIIDGLNSGYMSFNDKIDISEQTVKNLINDGLSFGQFYFLLVLFRFNFMLKILSPYMFEVFREKWRETPVHLRFEIITQIRFFCNNDEENEQLIDILREIHTNTQDPWIQTSLFDALKDLGALEKDAADYLPFAVDELNDILSGSSSRHNCTNANSFYNCQYDHPYSSAYIQAIDSLDGQQTEKFYKMALKGISDVFFGPYLLLKAEKKIGEKVCSLITKWTKSSVISKVMPQDSIRMFLLSHIILGKHNYPLISRFKKSITQDEISLFAAAELYYWVNRTDLKPEEIIKASKAAAETLFDNSNSYVIDTIFEYRENLIQANLIYFNAEFSVNFIEHIFQEETVLACRTTLKSLSHQKILRKINFNEDVNIRAIYILEELGSNMDIDVLQDLVSDQKYGKHAMNAIKKLFSKR